MEISTIRQLQAMARERRIALGVSQDALAVRARLSRKWVSEFERGKSTTDLSLVFRLLAALDLRVEISAPHADDLSTPAPAHGTDAVDLDALIDGYLAS